jgi:hypothetical protein
MFSRAEIRVWKRPEERADIVSSYGPKVGRHARFPQRQSASASAAVAGSVARSSRPGWWVNRRSMSCPTSSVTGSGANVGGTGDGGFPGQARRFATSKLNLPPSGLSSRIRRPLARRTWR